MRRTLFQFVVIGAAGFWCSSASVEASIQSADDPVFGVGSITQDTETGLDWLDLSHSTNLSFEEAATQMGAGGAFEGFRHATGSEIGALFTNLGLTIGGVVPDRGVAYLASETLLGRTVLLGGTAGVYDDGGAAETVDRAYIFPSRFPPGSGSSIGEGLISSSAASQSVGNWLVRESGGGPSATPEPAGLIVWGGLALTIAAVVTVRRTHSFKRVG